jgi:uncharacterized membrane protein YdbT with pleckstrin-like domain
MPTDDTPIASATEEAILWSGHTSHWVHFWYYLFCVVLAVGIAVAATMVGLATAGVGALGYLALLIPLVMWLIRWWITKCTHYELTSQRLRIRTGILNKMVDELELFRVKDYSMEQPFLLRLIGLGNISMVTSDASHPNVALRAIPGVEDVREKLRTAVQAERDRRRVRELDVDGSSESLS